ncbi:LacI family DNA-binding transcriptional regulator [Dongia sedimenti]|uniref:LacI family DNA-binding transcriptional regulator n=1 Tax=Dongia sedimenti TaxID=3064282 RepID=A0ABU0YI69_9PROT|nr:LacI family DNA-binding transcriptional regulator [Rhodospirillaceae bacterium R-7]
MAVKKTSTKRAALRRTGPARHKSFVSAEQVAERAGVSRSAVSRTFTPGASVSEDTRRRVMRAATELGYHVNHLARGLMRRSTGIVCLIVADVESPQTARMVRAITTRLQSVGKVAMMINISDPRDDAADALRQTLNYRADATVVMSGTPSQAIVRSCLDNGQRLILISRDDKIAGPHNIRLDNAAAARLAFAAFIRAGCRRLAVINSNLGTPSLTAREYAFVAQARAAKFEVTVIREGGMTSYENGLIAARRLFSAEQRPDGVFCVNDLLACGAMDVARKEFGLRVPEDVSFIGFDNMRQADWLSYGLTTFDQPVEEIADNVAALATENGTRRQPARVEILPKMVWRSSVRI